MVRKTLSARNGFTTIVSCFMVRAWKTGRVRGNSGVAASIPISREAAHLSVNSHLAKIQSRPSSILWAAALAGLTIGCGLSDYQRQMAEQQARLARLDEEKTKLGD